MDKLDKVLAELAAIRETLNALASPATKAERLKLHRLRWWSKELGVGLETLQDAVPLGHLKAVQTGTGANSPFRCNEEHIREWLESRQVKGRRAW